MISDIDTPVSEEQSPKNVWATVCLLLALTMTALSFISRPDDWDEVQFLRYLNYLVIGPLWAAGVALGSKGKTRIVVAVLALLFPATMLSMFQTAIAAARFTAGPQIQTRQNMYSTLARIQEYMQVHRHAPPSLSAIPIEKDLEVTTKDAWNRPIQYSVDRDAVITLASFGADGKPGGHGENADIVMRYRTRNADGSLNVDDKDWFHDAKIESEDANKSPHSK
jgi:hypothetical protein